MSDNKKEEVKLTPEELEELVNAPFDPLKGHLYPEGYTAEITEEQLKILIPDPEPYDPFDPTDFSAKDLDLSKYKVRYHFDGMEFMLSENLPNDATPDLFSVKFVSHDGDESGVYRYFKTRYPNRDLFLRQVVNGPTLPLDDCPNPHIAAYIRNELYPRVIDGYDNATAYSYTEAFEIANDALRALVFDSINISEMIENLGHERLSVKGIPVKRKQYSPGGEYIGDKEYDNIYEVHKVDGTKLNVQDPLYAVKCWCTSTNKEHWIWIEEQYKDDPLEAIASTFRFHKNVIPHIKEIKRQGDIMIVEMKEKVDPIGEIVPLTAEQYFGLLTAES
jgi:hypothetical protein